MKKVVLVLALFLGTLLSANAAKILDVPRASINEFIGKYIVTINHRTNQLDFYRMTTELPSTLVLVNSFDVLDEAGNSIEGIESFKRMKITPGFLDLSSEAVTADTRTLIVATYRDRIKEGKENKTVLKTIIINPIIDESDNINGIETVAVLDLGPQPVTKF